MPGKNFKNSPALAFIGNAQNVGTEAIWTHETHETQGTQGTRGTHETHETHETQGKTATKYYRINLKLNAAHQEYLERVSWEAHKSITQYLNDLIEADRNTKNI